MARRRMNEQKSIRKKRKLGTMKGKIKIIDPDWWKPMTDKEVQEFIGDDDFGLPPRPEPDGKTNPKP